MLAGGCGGDPATAVRVVLEIEAGVTMDAVRFEVDVPDSAPITAELPGAGTGAIANHADAVVLFDPARDGARVTIRAAGLAAGAQVASGSVEATVRAQTTVTVHLTLAAASCAAGTHDCAGACFPDGDATHCGLACALCPTPSHASATCSAGQCGVECLSGTQPCDAACVDVTLDPANCGQCGRRCGAGTICQGGECVTNGCGANLHPCSGSCVSNGDPAHCGSSCSPCPAPASAAATCDGTACGFTCNGGYHKCGASCAANSSPQSCGSSCTPCTAPANATATCDGSACGFTCNGGFHRCGASCAASSSPQSCGSSCTPCAAPANATATCDGSACGFTCNGGYALCLGGCIPSGQPCGGTVTWREGAGGPPARSRPMMDYDGARQVTVLYGGWNGSSALADTWEWDGASWTDASTATGPGPRTGAVMVYDPPRQKMLLYGGWDAAYNVYADTWTYDGATWSQRTVTGPPARALAAAAYDSVSGQVLVFGGWNGTGPLNDLWAWNGSAWHQVPTTGGPPAARTGAAMIFDPAHNGGEAVLFGGSQDDARGAPLGDAWRLFASGGWQLYPGTPPSARVGPAFVWAGGRGLLFGGASGDTFYATTYAWDGIVWSPLTLGTAPDARYRAGSAWDSHRNVLVLFGGYSLAGHYSDTWELGP
jgi:hypothetical protein